MFCGRLWEIVGEKLVSGTMRKLQSFVLLFQEAVSITTRIHRNIQAQMLQDTSSVAGQSRILISRSIDPQVSRRDV